MSVVPNRRQLAVQGLRRYAFAHYGVNTFTNREWGTERESKKVFAPKKQDPDQWRRAVRDANVVEDWDISDLRLGQAIVGFPGMAPFVFQFKKTSW